MSGSGTHKANIVFKKETDGIKLRTYIKNTRKLEGWSEIQLADAGDWMYSQETDARGMHQRGKNKAL